MKNRGVMDVKQVSQKLKMDTPRTAASHPPSIYRNTLQLDSPPPGPRADEEGVCWLIRTSFTMSASVLLMVLAGGCCYTMARWL